MTSRTEQELRGRVATLEERIEVLCKENARQREENAQQRDAMRRLRRGLPNARAHKPRRRPPARSSPRKSRLLGGIRKSQTKSAIDGNDKGISGRVTRSITPTKSITTSSRSSRRSDEQLRNGHERRPTRRRSAFNDNLNTTIGNIRRQSALAVGGILQRAGGRPKRPAIFTFDDDASGGGRTMHQLPGLHACWSRRPTGGTRVTPTPLGLGRLRRSMKPLLWGTCCLGCSALRWGSPRGVPRACAT